ncbi:MAG: hypothetical protein O2899_04205 [Bacteroidetes bacterium]|nr:hypothetical protein [Bacteroidota bacterium]
MLASPYHQITASSSVRGIILWIVTCFTVFYVINGLATRPMAVEGGSVRKTGMNDEQVLAMALQEANESKEVAWWINDRETYLVFDTTRDYRISAATFAAYDLEPTTDAQEKPIAVFSQQKAAGIQAH